MVLLLHRLRLHTETSLLLIFEHGLDKLAHDSSFLRLNLVNLFPGILVLLPHLVQFHPKVVALLIELSLLAII